MYAYYDKPKFKVATVQSGTVYRDEPQWFDVEATLEKRNLLKIIKKGSQVFLVYLPAAWLVSVRLNPRLSPFLSFIPGSYSAGQVIDKTKALLNQYPAG